MTVASEVGHNLKRLRHRAGRSLADLANAADISKTTLHAIEQGEANPTLSTLWALATALQVPLGELLDPAVPQVDVVRADQGTRADGDAVHARLLHRIPVQGSIEVYEIGVDPVRQVSQPHAAGVDECLIVTAGGVTCGPEHNPVDLRTGDSIRFAASVPHIYEGADTDSHAILLMIHR